MQDVMLHKVIFIMEDNGEMVRKGELNPSVDSSAIKCRE